MRYTLLIIPFLAGCLGMPDQKLAEGETGCVTFSTIQGSGSQVRTREDNLAKGSSGTGEYRITCGSAVLERKNTVTVPVPAASPAPAR